MAHPGSPAAPGINGKRDGTVVAEPVMNEI